MTENKKVTWRFLKAGQEIRGYEQSNLSCGLAGYVKSANVATVTIEKWHKGGDILEVPSEGTMFLIEMDEDEIRRKYNDAAGHIVRAIQNRLLRDEIGDHEMCNSWLSDNPWEIAQHCKQDEIRIVGHCRDIIPKTAMFSGDILDVGVCSEYEDGERFWCHFRSHDIDMMQRLYEKYQKVSKDGTAGKFDLYEAKFEIEEELE